MLTDALDLNVEASSISYVAGRSKANPSVLTAAASNLLHAVNTIATGLGLDTNAHYCHSCSDQRQPCRNRV